MGQPVFRKTDERFLSCSDGLQLQPTPGVAGRPEERGKKKSPATSLGMTALSRVPIKRFSSKHEAILSANGI